MGAFEDIIAQCIEGSGPWVGFWTLDGEVYNISNFNYPHNPLLPGEDGGPGSLEPNSGPCDYPKHNPATFVDSGGLLAANGDDDWFFAMERATTNGQGTTEEPSCGVIESNNCNTSKDCREYTSTEFYYVRLVSGLINQFFTRAHESLQDETIMNILTINEIIADFEPDTARPVDRNIFSIVVGASTIVGAVAGAASGPSGVPFSLFGGIISIVGASIPTPEVFDIEHIHEQASMHLKNIFNETRESTKNLLARLFGNVDVKYSLLDLVDDMKNRGFQPVADDWDPTAIIFSMPWMSESGSVDFANSLTEGVRLINQGLVGAILKAMGYKVIVIKNFSESECSEIEGSQFIDNDCYAVSSGCGVLVYDYMDAADIKLLPEKYRIDMVEFFKSVRECSEHDTDSGFVSSTGYPACFFNLDLVETNRYYQEKCSLQHDPSALCKCSIL